MPIKVSLKTAREVEDLLAKGISLAEGTPLIAESILKGIKIAQRNVMTNFYKAVEKDKVRVES